MLGTVGEPINPETWRWYFEKVGQGKCCIVDTWWQTETGGILITPLPGITPLKPGSATLPVLRGQARGRWTRTASPSRATASAATCASPRRWPGQARTVWGDHHRFYETYFSQYPGYYFTGDGCRRDEDGYYWITGRVDDVINVSGHRMGTAEVESALVAHEAVAEAAVVGFPHEIKGQGIFAYVILHGGHQRGRPRRAGGRPEGAGAARDRAHRHAGRHHDRAGAAQDPLGQDHAAHPAQDRRQEYTGLGDVSTLADPAVVDQLIEARKVLK